MHQSTWMATNLKNQRKTPSERAREARDSPLQAVAATKSASNPKSKPQERWIQATSLTRIPNSFSSRTMPTFRSMATCRTEARCPELVVQRLKLPKSATWADSLWLRITITLKRTTTTICEFNERQPITNQSTLCMPINLEKNYFCLLVYLSV